jgi:hypothetical protein
MTGLLGGRGARAHCASGLLRLREEESSDMKRSRPRTREDEYWRRLLTATAGWTAYGNSSVFAVYRTRYAVQPPLLELGYGAARAFAPGSYGAGNGRAAASLGSLCAADSPGTQTARGCSAGEPGGEPACHPDHTVAGHGIMAVGIGTARYGKLKRMRQGNIFHYLRSREFAQP